MIRSILWTAALASCLPASALLSTACSSAPNPREHPATTGSVTLPLTTVTGGATYRLENVFMEFFGPSFATLNETNADEAVLSTTLQTGSWQADLVNFTLKKKDGQGNFMPVIASLEQNLVPFTIFNGTTTTLVFRFQTDGVIITVGSGQINVVAAVDQVPPVCTVLGSNCTPGTWCAPADLTGAALACIAAGATTVGQPCSASSDCVANAACFESGTGPVCAALCASSDFNAPCALGGVCVPAASGSDYGICRSAGAGDGGLEGGGLEACKETPASTPLIIGSPASPAQSPPFTYAAPGLSPPTVASVTLPDGGGPALQVTASPGVTTDPSNAFFGFGFSFNSTACVDASAFTGIEFTITGDLGTCSTNFSVTDSEDLPIVFQGTCTASSCFAPSTAPLTAGTHVIHFADLSNGSPVPTLDSAALMGVSWNMNVPTDGESAPCAANFTISDLSFTNR
jgi:hypothetical protein